MTMELLIALIAGLIVGAGITAVLLRSRIADAHARGLAEGSAESAVLAERHKGREEALAALEVEVGAARERIESLNAERTAAAERIATLTTTLAAEQTQAAEKIALLNEAREQLKVQFENLANQIFEEKGQKFAKQNQANLDLLLNPLGEKIKAFQEQVAQTYDKESKERLTLQNEVERLAKLNAQISTDAINLTQALKAATRHRASGA
jgi:DNA recombination protein RmuC